MKASEYNHEMHHSRRWFQYATIPDHKGNFKIIDSGLCQVNGLLSTFNVDAGRHSGYFGNFNARIYVIVPRIVG